MKYVAVCIVAFKLILFDFDQIQSTTSETSEEAARSECVDKIREVDDSNFNTNVVYPPTLTGKWVSKRCETRPGPQFILRSYTFQPDNVFQLIQFRYNDESCSLIGYTIKIVGSYRMKKWSSPSLSNHFVNETRLSYDVKRVTVIVHDIYWTKNLSRMLRDSCKSYTSDTPYWTPFVEYHIPVRVHKKSNSNVESTNGDAGHSYHNISYTKHNVRETRDFDYNPHCLSALGIRLDELRTLRVHARKSVHGQVEHELLLAANAFHQQSHNSSKPLSIINDKFQPPLVLVNESANCLTCEAIARSTNMFVKNLPAKATIPLNLRINGEWISERCEVGLMATADVYSIRMLSVDERNRDWNLETKFYDDYKCVKLSAVHRAFGKLHIGRPSKKMVGATEIAFDVRKTYLMATSSTFLSRLQRYDASYDNDLFHDWKPNEIKEVPTNGFNSTVIPNATIARFNFARLEIDEDGSLILLLGEKSWSIRRFTSYQYPLLQCSSHTFYSYFDTLAYSQYTTDDGNRSAYRQLRSFHVITSISSTIFIYFFIRNVY